MAVSQQNDISDSMSKYEARMQTVNIFIEEKNRLFNEGLQVIGQKAPDTTPESVKDVDCRLGTTRFYDIVNYMEMEADLDSEDYDFDYNAVEQFKEDKTGTAILLEHYLRKHLASTGVSPFDEPPHIAHKSHIRLLDKMDELNLDWGERTENSVNGAIKTHDGVIWLSGMTYNTMKRMQNRIRDLVHNHGFEPEFKQALTDFPEKFNAAMNGVIVEKKDFCETLCHELTHYTLVRNDVEYEEYESIEEAFCFFTGLTLFETNPRNAGYGAYNDPKELETFVELIFRKSMEVEGSRIDWARKELVNIISSEEPKQKLIDEMAQDGILETFEELKSLNTSDNYNKAFEKLEDLLNELKDELSNSTISQKSSLIEDVKQIKRDSWSYRAPAEYWFDNQEKFRNWALSGESQKIKRSLYKEYMYIDGHIEDLEQLEEDLLDAGIEEHAKKLEEYQRAIAEFEKRVNQIYSGIQE